MSSYPTPADLLKNLSFDKMTVDTSIAEAYIAKHESKFPPLSRSHNGINFELDSHGNKIFKSTKETPISTLEYPTIQESMYPSMADCRKFKKIAQIIMNNADLFAQLEYLIRKISIDEVKKYDVNLIAKRFGYYGSRRGGNFEKYDKESIHFLKHEPLAILGAAAELLFKCRLVVIWCDVDTAALGTLFTEICYEAGFSNTQVLCLASSELPYYRHFAVTEKYFLGTSDGSVAVVTDKSDIDSAVDAIIHATHNYRYSWRLRRILVQESIYERFQKTLACRSQANSNVEASIKNKSAAVYVANNKVFLSDYTGDNLDETKPFVFVEGFRTTKEVISLLNKYRPLYLSIWCSDISVSNEISFATKAQHIWINNFGDFGVPKDIALASLDVSQINTQLQSTQKTEESNEIIKEAACTLVKLREKWVKIDVEDRVDIINKVIEEFNAKGTEGKYIDKIIKFENHSFVKADKGKLCIGIAESLGVVLLDCPDKVIYDYIREILKSIINGNGMVINTGVCIENISRDFILMLGEAGVPIIQVKCIVTDPPSYSSVQLFDALIQGTVFNVDSLYRHKVIFSQFGETFAN